MRVWATRAHPIRGGVVGPEVHLSSGIPPPRRATPASSAKNHADVALTKLFPFSGDHHGSLESDRDRTRKKCTRLSAGSAAGARRPAGTDAAHIYGGFLAHLTAWCEERELPYEGVPVATIKRFATGKGNASKEAVIDAIKARGFQPADDNEADALAILLWAIDAQGGAA